MGLDLFNVAAAEDVETGLVGTTKACTFGWVNPGSGVASGLDIAGEAGSGAWRGATAVDD